QGVRTSLPRAAWLFVLAVVAAATVVVALYAPAAVRHLADGGGRAAWQPLLYVAGLVLAERFVVKVPMRNHRFSVGTCDMVIVLGVVFLDPPVLVIATGVGIAVSQALSDPQPVKRLFNVPQYILSVAVAAAVSAGLVDLLQRSELFGGQPEPGVFRPALAVVWVVAMAAFFLVNHSLVGIVVSLSTGQGLVQSWLRAAPVGGARGGAPRGAHRALGGLRPPGRRRAQLRGRGRVPRSRRGRRAGRHLHRRHRPPDRAALAQRLGAGGHGLGVAGRLAPLRHGPDGGRRPGGRVRGRLRPPGRHRLHRRRHRDPAPPGHPGGGGPGQRGAVPGRRERAGPAPRHRRALLR